MSGSNLSIWPHCLKTGQPGHDFEKYIEGAKEILLKIVWSLTVALTMILKQRYAMLVIKNLLVHNFLYLNTF